MTVAHRIGAIESVLTSSDTVDGSVEAPSHHADEAGDAEILNSAGESFSFLDDIFDDDAPMLAVDLDVDMKPAVSNTTGKKSSDLSV